MMRALAKYTPWVLHGYVSKLWHNRSGLCYGSASEKHHLEMETIAFRLELRGEYDIPMLPEKVIHS